MTWLRRNARWPVRQLVWLARLSLATVASRSGISSRARFTRQPRVARRSIFYKAKTRAQLCTAGQSKAVCNDGIDCTALPHVHSALRWLAPRNWNTQHKGGRLPLHILQHPQYFTTQWATAASTRWTKDVDEKGGSFAPLDPPPLDPPLKL